MFVQNNLNNAYNQGEKDVFKLGLQVLQNGEEQTSNDITKQEENQENAISQKSYEENDLHNTESQNDSSAAHWFSEFKNEN